MTTDQRKTRYATLAQRLAILRQCADNGGQNRRILVSIQTSASRGPRIAAEANIVVETDQVQANSESVKDEFA